MMRVAKWGNSLAVRLPDAIVKALQLKAGDEIEIVVTSDREFQVERDTSRARWFVSVGSAGRCLSGSASTGTRPTPAKRFFDTNVLIYAFAADDQRSIRADALLGEGGVIGV